MLGLFTSPKKRLEKKYRKLLKDAFELSHTDRTASDRKMAEAEEIAKKLDQL